MSDGNQDQNRRHSDAVVIALSQKFNDFIERYDRDCGASNEWRRQMENTVKANTDLLREISPAYNRGKWIAGLILIGSVAIAVKAFWSHLIWHP